MLSLIVSVNLILFTVLINNLTVNGDAVLIRGRRLFKARYLLEKTLCDNFLKYSFKHFYRRGTFYKRFLCKILELLSTMARYQIQLGQFYIPSKLQHTQYCPPFLQLFLPLFKKSSSCNHSLEFGKSLKS